MNKKKWIPFFWMAAFLTGGVQAADPLAMTLQEGIELAMRNNLDIKIETINRNVTLRDQAIARGGYDPEFSLSGGYAHTRTLGESAGVADGVLQTFPSTTDENTYRAALGGLTPWTGLQYEVGGKLGDSSGDREGNPFDTSTGNVGLTLTQPLLRGLWTDSTRYQVAIAISQGETATTQLEAQMQEILYNVEIAWYGLISARETIRVQEEAVQLAEQLAKDNAHKVLVGSLSKLDEKQAESQAATARAALSAAKRAYSEAQNQVKALIFADQRSLYGQNLHPEDPLSDTPVLPDMQDCWDRALDGRPDLRMARLELKRQGITVNYQRNDTLPRLDLVGGYGLAASNGDDYGDALDRIGNMDEPYWNVGVTLTVPLGNRTAKNKWEQSRDTESKLKLQLQKLEENALVEVENAVHSVETGYEQIISTREARIYAEEALSAEQRKLESGKSTSFIVLQLQKNLTEARKDEIDALVNYSKYLATLARAEGFVLERMGVEFISE